MRQIITRWTVPGASAEVLNITHWADTSPVTEQRDAWAQFMAVYQPAMGAGVSLSIDTTGREMSISTGVTEGFWNDPVPHIITASAGAQQPAANATSVLMQWVTGEVLAGRQVKGRTFLPGFAAGAITQGGTEAGFRTAMAAGAQDLVDAGVGFSVWSRPNGTAVGSLSTVIAGTCWAELAVQTRRRG